MSRWWVNFTLGLLIRRSGINAIRQWLDRKGLRYEIKEYKGWLSSDYLLQVWGDLEQILTVQAEWNRWVREVLE